MKRLLVINKFILFAFIYLTLQVPCIAQEPGCQYELNNGNIRIFDYLLKPRYPLTADSITCTSSPDRRWIIIQSGYRLDVDIWLYDSYSKMKPLSVDTDPGNNTIVVFHGNKVFEVRWGGMGYRMSDFYQVDKPQEKVHIDDVLLYFEELDAYVSFYDDGVEIGRVFDKVVPEKIHIDFDLPSDPSASSPLYVIDKIGIVGDELIVVHRKSNGKRVTDIFKPKLLKGNTQRLESKIES